MIGLERGWRARAVADGGRVAGLRTFALVGLLGGVLAIVGPLLLAAGAFGLALIGAAGYRESVRSTGNLSATSAVALLLSFGLGALAALDSPGLAVSAAVLVAVLLDLRPTIHRWLRMIDHPELSAALQLLVLSAVVLPLLPDAPLGPYQALNPYRLWWAVVMVAGLSMSGHVAMHLVGPQAGAVWTGLLGGLASSTGATLALARQVRAEPALRAAALAGCLAATAMMCLRMALIVAVLAPGLLPRVLPALLAAAATMIGGALWHWRRRRPVVPAAASAPAAGELRPFDPLHRPLPPAS
ncbi:MgtC/SapB family protein [Aquabacterium sp.]|uniref:MgtC/SapB family protein n=1 Tax=Aquabacterium sp. TaxID=1872578 RepID=UPI003783F936